MAPKRAARTENQRKVLEFLREHFNSQDAFTKKDLEAVTTWRGKSFGTYWSKQLKPFVGTVDGKMFRVTEAFRAFATWDAFQRHVTQVRRVYSDYTLLRHDALLIFEFFMPLTNETQLRMALDALFYKDTISRRLRALDTNLVYAHFAPKADEHESDYFSRLCEWLERRFGGYSISNVSGRFRAERLMTIQEAARLEQNGGRYLIDETTAIVRFIFPCGEPVKTAPGVEETQGTGEHNTPTTEAETLRWFFHALFVESVIQVVNGEAEIWMVESGMQNRLHIWKVEANT
jgi:hypothetical protein